MTDERVHGKKPERSGPGIGPDDPDADSGFRSSGVFCNGDLFGREPAEHAGVRTPEDDFELNRFSAAPTADEAATAAGNRHGGADEGPIIPDREEIRIPPVAGAARAQPKKQNGTPPSAAVILAVAAMLVSLYAVWLGSGQSEKVAQLEKSLSSPGGETDKRQDQEISALSGQLGEIEKEQKKLAAMKAGLESMILKQADQYEARLAAQKTGLEASLRKQSDRHKAELAELTQRQTEGRAKPAAPAAGTPPEDKTELPGPIESAEAQATGSSSAGRQGSWGVNLMSVESETAANKEIGRLGSMGIQAEAISIVVGGRQVHRIRVAGFASKQEALDMQAQLAREHDIKDTWVNNQ